MPSHRPAAGRHRAPARGRHRRPAGSRAPAYFTAATVAAFVVAGVNVQTAIGDSHDPPAADTAAAKPGATTAAPVATAAAVALREQFIESQGLRASRARRAEAVAAAQVRTKAAEVRTKKKKAATATARKKAEAARPKWVQPLGGARLSARFGQVSYLWRNRHTGQDLSAPYGTPVRSVGDGRIIFSGWDGAYGKKLEVEHADGTVSWYAHLSSYVKTSGRVSAGEVIGRVGSTGNSTGNHLHLEIRPGNGDPIEPMGFLRRHGAR